MKVLFEPAARRELNDIFDWIAKQNSRAANDLVARIEAKIMRLQVPNLAHMGRPGVVEGTRELIEYPYIIVSTMIEMRLSLYRLYTAPVIASLNERGGRNSGRGHLHSPDWLLVG